jgi:hypothetical protein
MFDLWSMLADLFPKELAKLKHEDFFKYLGLEDIGE